MHESYIIGLLIVASYIAQTCKKSSYNLQKKKRVNKFKLKEKLVYFFQQEFVEDIIKPLLIKALSKS